MEKVKVIKEEEKLCLGAIRATVIDTINKANSGHPGMALDAAPILFALFSSHLVADPAHPDWVNRDRLVFSSGHASALLYATLHVAGYPLTIEDLKNFRQIDSLTPGHPEVGLTKGVDSSAGPLGQGIAQAVGMAIAEKAMRACYKEGERLIDHYTYCLCGDGCLEEGISQEAISLAGQLGLNKLILFYDRNGSTLDGPTSDSLSENVKLRFLSSNWDVIEVANGENVQSIVNAISQAKESSLYPTLIIVDTKIGYGSKNEGSCKTHGSPLGEEDGAYAKKNYGYDYPPFEIPAEVYSFFQSHFAARGKRAYEDYQKGLEEYKKEHPEEFERYNDALNRDIDKYIPAYPTFSSDYKKASRQTSGEILKVALPNVPFLMGGSADVASSTNTNVESVARFTQKTPEGRDMRFGVREFAMASLENGMLLHGGVATYCACFFVFADYMKPAIRMAALQHLPSIYLFTHDSLAVGEDGPTHQPVEQLAMLRATPNLLVIRPADGNEVVSAYQLAFASKSTPCALILSRQGLPLLEGSDREKAKKGAYRVYGSSGADIELLATGSEVSLAIESAKILEKEGNTVEVISLPCLELFEEQEEAYRGEILDAPYDRRVSIELASTFGWGKYAKHNIGVDAFGKSGKSGAVLDDFGFTPEKIAKKVAECLKK